MSRCSQCGTRADRLRILADWFDLKDVGEGNDNHEVQRDLREWAAKIDTATSAERTD